MISTAAMHRVSPWLVGLFLLAQIFGVVPLISCHSAHAAGGASILCEYQTGADALPQSHHHLGDADDAAHHHALQDLSGVMANSPDRREESLVHIVITAPAPRALAPADQIRLERPPKPVLSV
jgi:hypothetical protein